MSIFRDFGSSARSQRAPVTVGLVIAIIAGFLTLFMKLAPEVMKNLGFLTLDAWAKPWTFVTYPLLGSPGDFLGLVFLCMWLWSMGGSVERDLGSGKFLAVWLIFTAICALALWIGAKLLGTEAWLLSAWVPVAALTVIWGTRNATAQILLMFVIPISGKWLAWLSAGLVIFAVDPPQMAPFAAIPLVLAYAFAANRLPFAVYGSGPARGRRGVNPAGTRRVEKPEYYDEVKRREKSREERERLRKLFEQSMVNDPDEEK